MSGRHRWCDTCEGGAGCASRCYEEGTAGYGAPPPCYLLTEHQHIIRSWSSHLLIVATRTYKAKGELFLGLNDAILDFKCPSLSPEITVHLL